MCGDEYLERGDCTAGTSNTEDYSSKSCEELGQQVDHEAEADENKAHDKNAGGDCP